MNPRFVIVLALLVAGSLVPACGEEAGSDAEVGGAAPPGAATEGGGTEPRASGADSLVRTQRELLASLHRRLTTGEGLHDQTWQDDTRRVAEALWPPDEAGRVPSAGRVHVQLAGIAASTARYVLRDDAEGARYLAENPEDRVAYDAFLAAVVTGPDGYRAWVESEGSAVLATWQADRRARILGR